jgi:uncharacterized protein with von Willebrand factor type A (vWA) domain
MDQRILDFIAALRATGVRISVAESADSLRAIEATGVGDRDMFRAALRATLVKDAQDLPTFDEQFPLFFGTGAPPLPNQPGGGMTDEQREQMQQMLQEMLRNMTPEQLRELFRSMMTGQPLSAQQMQQMLQELLQQMQQMQQGMQQGRMSNFARSAYMRMMLTRQAMRELEFDRLDDMLLELLEQLRAAGVSEAELEQLMREALENKAALGNQLSEELERGLARDNGQQPPQQPQIDDLMERPFEELDPQELTDLRQIVNRLAARLRSRAALRLRRASRGQLDAKGTIRANLRFGGVPLDVRHRRKHLKPKLVVICDRSVSTDRVVTFLLLLIYALQDQISRTRAFAFIDTLHDISTYFDEARPEQAIPQIIHDIQPKRSYSTDLGNSLQVFLQEYAGCVDHRTTVIFLGDARNNQNDPNLAAFRSIKGRAKRVLWFNPEPRFMWGRYDPGSLTSDMLEYAPLCDAVHEVRNLSQLVAAVDTLFSR